MLRHRTDAEVNSRVVHVLRNGVLQTLHSRDIQVGGGKGGGRRGERKRGREGEREGGREGRNEGEGGREGG